MKRDSWGSRSTFILASVGSAVGLGNAWRFPGLAAKHGGGAFVLVYLVMLLALGIPLVMMETSLGRKMRGGPPTALAKVNKKFEPIGWAASANAFVIVTYYAVVFAWVLAMIPSSIKFAGMTRDSEAASNVFFNMTQTTGDVTGYSIPPLLIVALIVAWALIYICIRDGASSVSKVVKYTVFIPIILMIVLAVKGLSMDGCWDGMKVLLIPDWSSLSDVTLWVDAIGQVFFSLSIMMAIMIAYGSFVRDDANLAVDCVIIAFSDLAISLLATVVMYSTLGGTGMMDSISASGISTAFIIYPQAIVNLTGIGWINALFGIVFYLMLATLAVDSAFSIVEGASTAVSDHYNIEKKKTTTVICIISGIISILFITRAGLAWLDIVDNWTNQYNLIIIGILECLAIGWGYKNGNLLDEINKNTVKFKMPKWWFNLSVKFVAPILLFGLVLWNIITLFAKNGGTYNYAFWAEFLAGWLITILVFASGFIVKLIDKFFVHKSK